MANAPVEVPQAEQVRVEIDPGPTLALYAQHRRRFAREASAFEVDALARPSRCTEWSVADILRHSCDVDGWMRSIWSGAPLPFDSFDPRTTPGAFVAAARDVPDVEIRERYVTSCETMAVEVSSSGPERWGTASISPLGFVPWWLSALHVFYDSWLHERDVLLPLGTDPPVDPDEAFAVLAYSLALVGKGLSGTREPADLTVAGVRLVSRDGAVIVTPITDRPVLPDNIGEIIDALSGRGAVEDALPGADPAETYRLGSLARFFHSAV